MANQQKTFPPTEHFIQLPHNTFSISSPLLPIIQVYSPRLLLQFHIIKSRSNSEVQEVKFFAQLTT